MGSPQQEGGDLGDGDEADAHQPDAEAATTQRSRSSRARAKNSTTPVPQSPSASRSKRSPRKAPRISVVGRKGSARSRNAAAEDDDGAVPSEQPDEQTEQEGVADEYADGSNEAEGEDDDADPDADAEGDVDADADADADGDDADADGNDDEEGVDEDGHKTVTIKGKTYRLEADGEEVILPSDPDGDKKIDDKGRLQGGRQYKAHHFTSDLRPDPEKVYMLSIDAARSAGYRDSLYFFRRNPQVFKIELLQAEKDKLIEDGRLSGQLKTRNVTMVPARNVYKLHGARFLSGGKTVIDDYYEAEARASGVKEGKTVGGMSTEEQEKRRESERERERPKKKADTFSYTTIDPQGEPVVTQFGDAGQTPWVRAGNWQSRKVALQRVDITEENWMLEMARSVRGMNTELGETRRDRMSAFPRFNRYVGLDGVAGPKRLRTRWPMATRSLRTIPRRSMIYLRGSESSSWRVQAPMQRRRTRSARPSRRAMPRPSVAVARRSASTSPTRICRTLASSLSPAVPRWSRSLSARPLSTILDASEAFAARSWVETSLDRVRGGWRALWSKACLPPTRRRTWRCQRQPARRLSILLPCDATLSGVFVFLEVSGQAIVIAVRSNEVSVWRV